MNCIRVLVVITLSVGLVLPGVASELQDVDAKALLRQAMELWRGSSSVSELSMTIKRSDWQRTMSMKAWTKGDKKSLVRVLEPKKDAGNGTLLIDNALWTFTPKINRVIKIPSSMMGQSWMGSDFTNKDISKSTDVLDQYSHKLLEVKEEEGRQFYIIEAIPHEDAAVVWGREIYAIRDDAVVMEQQFWDQDNILVKTLSTLDVVDMGGRPVAKRMRMADAETPDEWTEMETHSIAFDVDLPESLFTLSSLRNPR
ncbi:outer membrane lipoprotein-sorting protein [Teredinibacter haidensis]|uniref:outer membrane lipoprotein-sorting protein n=1 Tax=Teredinibacter haidensis TaxID=2731755 RepID=UPI00094901C9|nr:outer membrane lipoprotein-sorting protein [Teredinibacter haidensis]